MNEQILVVDDERDIVRLLRGSLEQAHFLVLVAYNGEDVLHTLRCERPDLLLLDLMLPDRIDDVDKIMGLELGADDYVTKPFITVAFVAASLVSSARIQSYIAEQMAQPDGLVLGKQSRENEVPFTGCAESKCVLSD